MAYLNGYRGGYSDDVWTSETPASGGWVIDTDDSGGWVVVAVDPPAGWS